MENNKWFNNYYTKSTVTEEEIAECGFKKGQPILDGYEEVFAEMLEAKPKYYDALADSGYEYVILATDGNIYYVCGQRMYEPTEAEIQEIIQDYTT